MNGRQIENATRTAHSLAVERGETDSGLQALVETLDALDKFTTQFEAERDRHNGVAVLHFSMAMTMTMYYVSTSV